MLRFAIPMVLAAFVVVADAASARADVNFQQAFAKAQAATDGGQLILARVEKNGTVYGFYFRVNTKITEVEISRTGKVVKKVTTEDEDTKDVSKDVIALIEKQVKGKNKLPEGRLLEIAADNLKDTPFSELKYTKVGDVLVVQIGNEFTIDAQTGKVTPIKK